MGGGQENGVFFFFFGIYARSRIDWIRGRVGGEGRIGRAVKWEGFKPYCKTGLSFVELSLS